MAEFKYINRSMVIATCLEILTSIATIDDDSSTDREKASAQAAIATVLDGLTALPCIELDMGPTVESKGDNLQ